MTLVVDIFAGPGGWDTGLRRAGYTGHVLGVEWDDAACRTAVAAGHPRVRVDVERFGLAGLRGLLWGLLGSPPCTTFSSTGEGAGRQLLGVLITGMTRLARGVPHALAWTRRAAVAVLKRHAAVNDKTRTWSRARRSEWARRNARTSVLVLQPLRYVLELRPRWVALEQVPAVQPVWDHLAVVLRELGYRVWTGVLSAEEYGVPQTRRRAVLMASLDGPVYRPEPTHQPYRAGRAYRTEPDLFGDPLPPPQSIAGALGWIADGLVVSNYGTGGNSQDRGERTLAEPSATITSKVDRCKVYLFERQAKGACRPATAPSPTITASLDNGNMRVGDDAQSRRLTVHEAGVLQSFPDDYPWQGTVSDQYRQVGDAVPPELARAIVGPLMAVSRRADLVGAVPGGA